MPEILGKEISQDKYDRIEHALTKAFGVSTIKQALKLVVNRAVKGIESSEARETLEARLPDLESTPDII